MSNQAFITFLILSFFTYGLATSATPSRIGQILKIQFSHSHDHASHSHSHGTSEQEDAHDHSNDSGHSHTHTLLITSAGPIAIPQKISLITLPVKRPTVFRTVKQLPPLERYLDSIFRPPIFA